MITGVVTANREATIRLVVAGRDQRWEAIEVVIGTGFNGFLTLPSHVVRALNLRFGQSPCYARGLALRRARPLPGYSHVERRRT